MSAPRILTAAVAITALAGAGVATAAESAHVSIQHGVAGKAPLTIPGTGVKKGDAIPAGGHIVFRSVTLEGKQQVRVTLKAPKGDVIRGVGMKEGSKVGGVVLTRYYVGKRTVVVKAFVAPTAGDAEVTGNIYALTK